MRSWASMNLASRARSDADGSCARQSLRWDGRCCFIVSRARCRAELAAATDVPSIDAVSAAGSPSTSRASSAARCRGGSTWSAARNASSIVSRATATSSGASEAEGISSRRLSGYGDSHGTSAYDVIRGTCRFLARIASMQTLVAIRYSHARTCLPSNVSRLRQARR